MTLRTRFSVATAVASVVQAHGWKEQLQGLHAAGDDQVVTANTANAAPLEEQEQDEREASGAQVKVESISPAGGASSSSFLATMNKMQMGLDTTVVQAAAAAPNQVANAAVASYNILIDLKLPPGQGNAAPLMTGECEKKGTKDKRQCVTNAGKLLADYNKQAPGKGQPPIVIFGEQEHMFDGIAPLQEGLGPDWKLLTSVHTCAVWYNQKELLGTPTEPQAANTDILFRVQDAKEPWRADGNHVRCLAAGYFPEQELIFASMWCDRGRNGIQAAKCMEAASARIEKVAAVEGWTKVTRVMIAMDSNEHDDALLGKEFGSISAGGKTLPKLLVAKNKLNSCCYPWMPLRWGGDYIADTGDKGNQPYIVPDAKTPTDTGAKFPLRSDHLPVMKDVNLPGARHSKNSNSPTALSTPVKPAPPAVAHVGDGGGKSNPREGGGRAVGGNEADAKGGEAKDNDSCCR